ncbi:MAG: hypothetical protein DRQ56_06655 [Gammaproteobacteria bacterium]|nr:MAG: hypothetical protein DRQ56_06655 [Gammaproteobacteria bacterium]
MSKLQTWFEMSQLLKATKTREAELRRELCEEYIGDSQMSNGRVTVKGHEGHLDYKAVQALSYGLDKDLLDALWGDLTDIDKGCVTFKPALGLAAYKRLSEDSLIHEAVTTRLAMPTLSVEEVLDDGN